MKTDCVEITVEEVAGLYFLSTEYDIKKLSEKTKEFIEEHEKEVIEYIIITRKFTERTEKIISDQLHEHFEEEIFFYISIPVMHLILSLYSTKHQE